MQWCCLQPRAGVGRGNNNGQRTRQGGRCGNIGRQAYQNSNANNNQPFWRHTSEVDVPLFDYLSTHLPREPTAWTSTEVPPASKDQEEKDDSENVQDQSRQVRQALSQSSQCDQINVALWYQVEMLAWLGEPHARTGASYAVLQGASR